MFIREIKPSEQSLYDTLVNHPQQSSAWAQFRRQQGLKVIQLGIFETSPTNPLAKLAKLIKLSANEPQLKQAWQMFVHPLPPIPGMSPRTILYCPKGPIPDAKMITAITEYARRHHAVFVKFEPQHLDSPESQQQLRQLGLRPGRSLYTPHNFLLDLTQSDNQLLANMKSKTRYNLRLAQKKGVTVSEDNTPQAFNTFIKLTAETTRRQKFSAHTADYHRRLWDILRPQGIAHLMIAVYQGRILSSWMLFKWKNTLYYPYGASSREHPEVMANHLMMWSAIQFGKRHGCTTFDLWGTAGADPKPTDPWYGFHHFKQGFNPQLVKYVGTWDLAVDPVLYPVVTTLDRVRQVWMKVRARLGFTNF